MEAFEAAVAAFDEVIELRRMFGLPDYFIRVATADLEHYEAFISTKLGDVPGIARLDSHLTMKTIKSLDGQLVPARGAATSRAIARRGSPSARDRATAHQS